MQAIPLFPSGLLHQRLCTKAEVMLYLQTLGQSPVGPTRNCQEYPGRRLKGCYPGFASFTIQDPSPMDFHQERDVPWRTDRDRPIDQLACCPGFFCPEGLACMIREFSWPFAWFLTFRLVLERFWVSILTFANIETQQAVKCKLKISGPHASN